MSTTTGLTYEKRLGVLVTDDGPAKATPEYPGIVIGGRRWATLDGLVAVFPDSVEGKLDCCVSLPAGVLVGMTNCDGLVKL